MPLHIPIQAGDDVPIYRQLVKQVEAAVITGRVKAGELLPSQRELAQSLVIAPLTVKRAYDVLEAAGFLRMERGRGTFACVPPKVSKDAADGEIREALHRVLELAWQHQISFARVQEMLESEERDYQREIES